MATASHYQYDTDYYGWLTESARLLRAGKFSEIDINHLSEEIEDMGKKERREIVSHLAILIAHLLKWQYQSEYRSNSWRATITEQRKRIEENLEESPSLKHQLALSVQRAYEYGVLNAVRETGKREKDFPAENPYSFEQLLDETFFP